MAFMHLIRLFFGWACIDDEQIGCYIKYENTYHVWSIRRIMCRKLYPCALGRQFAFDVIIVAGRGRQLCWHLDRIQNRTSDGHLTHGMDMKGWKVFSCAAAVTGLTAAFFVVSLFGAFSLGKVGFVLAVLSSPVLAVVAVSQWNELARRLRLSLAAACVAALAIVFVALQVAGVTLFHTDTVGGLYLLLGLPAVFIATLIVVAKF